MLIALLVPMVNSPPGIQTMADGARGVSGPEDGRDVAATGSLRITKRIASAAAPATAMVAESAAIVIGRVKRRAAAEGLERARATRCCAFHVAVSFRTFNATSEVREGLCNFGTGPRKFEPTPGFGRSRARFRNRWIWLAYR